MRIISFGWRVVLYSKPFLSLNNRQRFATNSCCFCASALMTADRKFACHKQRLEFAFMTTDMYVYPQPPTQAPSCQQLPPVVLVGDIAQRMPAKQHDGYVRQHVAWLPTDQPAVVSASGGGWRPFALQMYLMLLVSDGLSMDSLRRG